MPDLARVSEQAAASLRAPLKDETLPITVTTASKRFGVPAAWRGKLVNIQADGGDVYVQVSTAADAACDKDARATMTSTDPVELAPSASGNECWKIPSGLDLPVPFPSNASTFSLQSSVACCARMHLAET